MKQCLFFLFFAYTLPLAAQWPIENLVFEGAGIRGLAYAGVVQELETAGALRGIKRVGGTSAGAIAALLIGLGYTGAEIERIIGDLRPQRFNDGGIPLVSGLHRLQHRLGWFKGVAFDRWLERIIAHKAGNKDLTFAQWQTKGYPALFITGTNLDKQRLVVFSADNYPVMRVADAVRISMSVPLYFAPLRMDSTGRVWRRPPRHLSTDPMLDGGILANFPIHLFDGDTVSTATMGFRIDSDAQIRNDSSGRGLATHDVQDLPGYITAFYTLVLEGLNRQALTPQDWARTVSISDGALGPRIRKLSVEEKRRLVEGGRKATQTALEKRGWNEGL